MGKLKHETKSEIAAQYIQELILSGGAPAGSTVTTTSISEALGMSETPVREAIKSLATEGWLVHSAHRGTVVASLDQEQISEVFRLRGILNALAISLSADAFDDDRLDSIDANIEASELAVAANDFETYSELNRAFHDLLCNTGRADWTYRLFSTLQRQSAVFRHGFRAIPDGLRKSLNAHLEIRAALRAGDFARAAELANEDEVSAGDRLIRTLRRNDDDTRGKSAE